MQVIKGAPVFDEIDGAAKQAHANWARRATGHAAAAAACAAGSTAGDRR